MVHGSTDAHFRTYVPFYPHHPLAARRFHSHAKGRENLCWTTGCQVNAKLAIAGAVEESLDQTDSDPRLCQHCSGNFGKYGYLKITISSKMQEIIQKRPIVIAKFYLGGFKGRNQIPGDQVSENEQLIGHRQMWQFKHATIWTWKVCATLWDRLTVTSTPKSYANTL